MGAVATFDYEAWSTRYPELASGVAAPLGQSFFTEATLYHANDGSGPVADPSQQLLLLNMVTAHIASLNATIGGQAPSPLVGRITSASEGSVSVSVASDYPPGSAQWFAATRYGAAYWAATAAYRTLRYVPGRPRSGPFVRTPY